MRIECVGGGPAGLYFALLMKSREPGHDITVYERGQAASTYGWGVTLGKNILDILRDNDAASAREIERAGFRWRKQVVHFRGREIEYDGSDVCNISRQRLVDILAARARSLGVDIRYAHEVHSPVELPDADLIVAADGGSSRLRQAAGSFQTDIQEGRNKYIWLGTTRMFDRFNYLFARTDAGWVWAFAYGFAPELSTFIVECSGDTWDGLGFAAMPADKSLALLENIFEPHLDGHRLIGQFPDGTSARWQRYRTVTNQRWHAGNVVLLGDSAHTTHFSIGQGTKLAFEGAIALADSIRAKGNVEQALQAYEHQRRADLTRPLSEARCSAQWFENLPRYTALDPARFAALLHMRPSPLVSALPPRLSCLLHHAAGRSAVLGGVRGRLSLAAKVLYGRREAARRADDRGRGV
jgi:2-polyprenyl-6-methoxyphenol hydroxylase-like FAD-dependent oxidoreductase